MMKMTVEELKKELSVAGYDVMLDNGRSLLAVKSLVNLGRNEIQIVLNMNKEGGSYSAIASLWHGSPCRQEVIPVSADGASIDDWKPYVKKIVEDYLDEMEKAYARLSEFKMLGA